MHIANDQPDIILITEIIPKKQENPITHALLDIDGYKCLLNFNPIETNLDASGLRVEVDIPLDETIFNCTPMISRIDKNSENGETGMEELKERLRSMAVYGISIPS